MRLFLKFVFPLAGLLAVSVGWYVVRDEGASARKIFPPKDPAPQPRHDHREPISDSAVDRPAWTDAVVTTKHAGDAWTALYAQAPSPERDATLCGLLEDLAAHDPARARAIALAEFHEPLRTDLLRAVLSGWATSDLEAAGSWGTTQDVLYQDAALAAVFHGARSKPDEAVRYAQYLARANPARARDVGHYLIFALGEADEHQRAASYAAAGGALANEWLVAAYAQWSRHDPPVAIAAAAQLRDAGQRQAAFHAAISGWAKVDPAALLHYAETLRPGNERDHAIVAGLRALAPRQPEATAAWIAKSAPINGVEIVLED